MNASRTNLVGGLLDSFADLGIESISDIHDGCSLLEDTECFDEWWGESFRRTTNIKILKRSTYE